MSNGGKASENGGATAGADAYRYKIAVGDGNAVNVGIANGTYSGAGLGSTNAAWTSVSVAEITVGTNASTITLSNMENGFAIWVYGVCLVKLS